MKKDMEADKYRGYYNNFNPEEYFAQQYNRRYGEKNFNNDAGFYDLPAQYLEETKEAKSGHSGKGPRDYRRSDQRIYEDVNERLYYDHLVDATDIEVKVENGVVTLSGQVENKFGKRRAEEIAESVAGVINVENLLHTNRGVVKDFIRAFTGGIADSATGYSYDKYKRAKR
jgi:osmotically-inducible protein OsmY